MKKTLIAVLVCAVFGGCASVDQPLNTSGTRTVQSNLPVRITATGATVEIALQNAFRRAVESEVGFALRSEQEQRNNQLQRNEIQHYTSGYVDRYNVIRTTNSGRDVTVEVDVWISSQRVHHRILHTGDKPHSVDGNRAVTQVQTIRDGSANRNDALFAVIRDWDNRAFEAHVRGPHKWHYNNQTKNGEFWLPITIKWNQNYAAAMKDAFKQAWVYNRDSAHYVGFAGKWTLDVGYSGVNEDIYYPLRDKLDKTVSVTLDFMRDGRILYSHCFAPDRWPVHTYLYKIGPLPIAPSFSLYFGQELEPTLRLLMPAGSRSEAAFKNSTSYAVRVGC